MPPMKRNLPKIVVVIVLMLVFLYFFGRSVEWKNVPVQIAVTCALGYAILAREGLTLFQLKKMGESERR
jgi:hypothetical protein